MLIKFRECSLRLRAWKFEASQPNLGFTFSPGGFAIERLFRLDLTDVSMVRKQGIGPTMVKPGRKNPGYM